MVIQKKGNNVTIKVMMETWMKWCLNWSQILWLEKVSWDRAFLIPLWYYRLGASLMAQWVLQCRKHQTRWLDHGSGRSPGERIGNLLQFPCLKNPMDRGAWWATVQRVTKSQTQLSTAQTNCYRGNFMCMSVCSFPYTQAFMWIQMHMHIESPKETIWIAVIDHQ